jgi:hypothetical protein
MTLRLLTIPALTSGLLLSMLGCSKKDDPTRTTPVGTGSYTYDGTLVNCQASATTTSKLYKGQHQYYLYVTLQPTPKLSASKSVRAEFVKLEGQPNTAYRLFAVTYFADSSLVVHTLHTNNTAGTITETSSGSFTGTFAGTDFSNPAHTISAGTFTDVQL